MIPLAAALSVFTNSIIAFPIVCVTVACIAVRLIRNL